MAEIDYNSKADKEYRGLVIRLFKEGNPTDEQRTEMANAVMNESDIEPGITEKIDTEIYGCETEPDWEEDKQ